MSKKFGLSGMGDFLDETLSGEAGLESGKDEPTWSEALMAGDDKPELDYIPDGDEASGVEQPEEISEVIEPEVLDPEVVDTEVKAIKEKTDKISGEESNSDDATDENYPPGSKPFVPDADFKAERSLEVYRRTSELIRANSAPQAALEVINGASKLTDDQLRDIIGQSVNASKVWFIVTGSLAFEAKERSSKSGFQFSNRKGEGVKDIFADLSTELGLDLKTLYQDYRIFEDFRDHFIKLLSGDPERILPREYYATAVKTGDPIKTIEFFEDEYFKGGYNVKRARLAAKLFNSGQTKAQVIKADKEYVKNKLAESEILSKVETGDEKVPNISFVVPKTTQNVNFAEQIVEKYKTFDNWFTKRCKEEFDPNKVKETPKAKKPATAKATPKAKGVKAKPKGKVKASSK